MLKFLPLLWANLQRKRLRTALTLASIVIAFLLYGSLQTLRVAMTGTPQMAGADRLLSTHKMSLVLSMPQSYVNKVRAVPGVKVVCSHNWFGGIAKNLKGEEVQIPAFAVDAGSFFETYPELVLTDAQRKDFLSDRAAAIVGDTMATQFGWKVGDTVPLRSNIFVRREGGNAWPVRIAGIASGGNGPGLYMHYDYFNEARTLGRDEIGWMVLRISDPQRADQVSLAVDELFANSSTETKTATERAFAQGFANQLGNVAAIVTAVATAVFFTMLLVTANTMAESVRERTNELGVLKTLGFSSSGVTLLVLGEALLLTLLGAAIGLGLAALLAAGLGRMVEQFFAASGMPLEAYTTGVAVAVALGLLAAVLPCLRVWRLKITDALRKA